MGFTGGLVAIAASVVILLLAKAKNGVEKPFARNWMALVAVTMTIQILFMGGISLLLTSR